MELTLMCLASDFNFVTLHDLLDRFSNIAHSYIKTGGLRL